MSTFMFISFALRKSSLICVCALMAPLVVNAEASDLKLRYFVNEAYTDVLTKKVNGLRVNEACGKKPTACRALKVASGKPMASKQSQAKAPFIGNPGANYCWDLGAKNRILKDEKNNQYDFCVFDDGSMIDSWDLYRAHHSNEKTK